jgi:hypothetical protein
LARLLDGDASLQGLPLGLDRRDGLLQGSDRIEALLRLLLQPRHLPLATRRPEHVIPLGHRDRAPAPAFAHVAVAREKRDPGRERLPIRHPFDQFHAGQLPPDPVGHLGRHFDDAQGRAAWRGDIGAAALPHDEIAVAMRLPQLPGAPAVLGLLQEHHVAMPA